MAKYLITGGAGFIGSHLADLLLSKGHQVMVLDDLSTGKAANLDSRVQLIVGSICDRPLLKKSLAQCDGCFHLAAIVSVVECQKDWIKAYSTNNSGSMYIFDEARLASPQIPVVFASSAAIFGDNPHIPLDEESDTHPISVYGADKLSAEMYGRIIHGLYNLSITGLRFFNVFGPRQDPSSPYSGVISLFVNNIRQGKDINIFGDGEQTRDFIYVADVVMSLYTAMQQAHQDKPVFRVYNICTGIANSINYLASTVEKVFQKKVRRNFLEARVGDIKFSQGNPSLMNHQLGVKAQFNLESGLRLMGEDRHDGSAGS